MACRPADGGGITDGHEGALLRLNYERRVELQSQVSVHGLWPRPVSQVAAAAVELGRRLRSPAARAHPTGTYGNLTALGEIEMNMGFVVTIGARPEHCRKAMACAFAQVVAKRLRDRHVGQADGAAIGQHKRAQIGGVALAMLAELGAGHAIAAAALVVIVSFDRAQRPRPVSPLAAPLRRAASRREIRRSCSAAPGPA